MITKMIMINLQTPDPSRDLHLLETLFRYEKVTEKDPLETLVFIFRRDPYFYNRDVLHEAKTDPNKHYTVYTDDESALHFAPWDKDNKRYNLYFIIDDALTPIWEIYPNVRDVNNVEAMFRKGFFSPDNNEED